MSVCPFLGFSQFCLASSLDVYKGWISKNTLRISLEDPKILPLSIFSVFTPRIRKHQKAKENRRKAYYPSPKHISAQCCVPLISATPQILLNLSKSTPKNYQHILKRLPNMSKMISRIEYAQTWVQGTPNKHHGRPTKNLWTA